MLQEDPNNIDALEHIGYFFVRSGQPSGYRSVQAVLVQADSLPLRKLKMDAATPHITAEPIHGGQQ